MGRELGRIARVCTVGVAFCVAASAAWGATEQAAGKPAQEAEKKEQPRREVFLKPKDAGPDFQVQGEYEGTMAPPAGAAAEAAGKLGVQVIALGDGAFRAVFYPGGLPGAGWDAKAKVEVDGRTEGSPAAPDAADSAPTVFDGKGWTATVRDGLLTGRAAEGRPIEAKRVLRKSKSLGEEPPEGAVVLFDGTGVDGWQGGRMDERKLLSVGTTSKRRFGNFKLHLEFMTPFMPYARGQARGNSGVYLPGGYEIQVLDSFALEGRQNECGAIYGIAAPKVNMCLPPLCWQTYDVEFHAGVADESGSKVRDAAVTVWHNGVAVHKDLPLSRGGDWQQEVGPIFLQNHGNPVFYRNIWVVEAE